MHYLRPSRQGPRLTLDLELASIPAALAWPVVFIPQALHVIATDARDPTGRLCLDCFGLLEICDDSRLCEHCGKLCDIRFLRCREAGCRKIDHPVFCGKCTDSAIPRVRTVPRRARKIISFAEGGSFSPGLLQKARPLKFTTKLLTATPRTRYCHARRLDLQFQLYQFAQAHRLVTLEQLVRFKIWHMLLGLQPHPYSSISLLTSLLSAISKLPFLDELRTVLTMYWACVREDMRKTAPEFELFGSYATQGTLHLDSVENILSASPD